MTPTVNIRFIGGMLLVAGTTIGAGMLALPVVSSFGGFLPSVVIFISCWLVMLCSAFFFLDVNLSIKGEPNLISMVGKTLGGKGKLISWILYLLLMYSLLAAYISASAPLFAKAIFALTGKTISESFSRFCLPVVFASFLYLGIRGIDFINRILMLGLILSYFLLVGFIPCHIEIPLLSHVDFSASLVSIPVVLTAFGYHIIIPSLSTYLHHDKKMLRGVIFWGSLIPIVVYLVWEVMVLGTVPQDLLSKAWVSGVPASQPLSEVVQKTYISKIALFFSFFAIATSFLGVALSLSDFLKDGLNIKKNWEGRLTAFSLTFIPPLVFLTTFQRGFYIALQYAGIIVALLLGILPCLMAWKVKTVPFYKKAYGKLLIAAVILVYIAIIALDFLEKNGALHIFIESYLT